MNQQTSWFRRQQGTTGVTRHTRSGALAQYAKAIQEALENMALPGYVEFRLSPLEATTAGLAASAVILTGRPRKPGRPADQAVPVFYYVYILEQTYNKRNEPVITLPGGQQITAPFFIGGVNDEKYEAAVLAQLKNQYPNAADIGELQAFNYTGTCVLTNLVEPDAKESISTAINNGVLMIAQAIHRLDGGYEPFTIADAMSAAKNGLEITLRFRGENMVGYDALPIETQFSASLQTPQPRGNAFNGSQNSDGGSMVLGQAHGYPDFAWHGQTGQQGFGGTERYTPPMLPRVIITSLDSEVPELGPLLVSLTSILPLRDLRTFAQMLSVPPVAPGAIHPQDPGALNIEANIPLLRQPGAQHVGAQALLMDRANYGDPAVLASLAEVDAFVQYACVQYPIISLEVPETGASSAWMLPFIFAHDHATSQKATLALNEEMNTLTEGAFTPIWQAANCPAWFQPVDERVPLGYYTGADGKIHSTASVNYLAVMNVLGRDDPQIAAQWASTGVDSTKQLAVRIRERMNIVEAVVKSDVHWVDIARRLTFTNGILDVLQRSMQQAGFAAVRVDANMASAGGRQASPFTAAAPGVAGFGAAGGRTVGGSNFFTGALPGASLFN